MVCHLSPDFGQLASGGQRCSSLLLGPVIIQCANGIYACIRGRERERTGVGLWHRQNMYILVYKYDREREFRRIKRIIHEINRTEPTASCENNHLV